MNNPLGTWWKSLEGLSEEAFSVQGEEQLSILCLVRTFSNIPCHRTFVVVVLFFLLF